VPGSTVRASYEDSTGEGERAVAWLRLPAIALFAYGEGLDPPNPDHSAFVLTLAVFSAWSVAMLASVYLRPVGSRLALSATGIDIAAISTLAVFSGGAFSHARLAYFLIPVTAAFRLRASVTAAAAIVTICAYVLQASAHPSASQPGATRFIVVQAGFLAWIGLASVLLSLLLGRRTAQVERLAEDRAHLLADALDAEQRERQALAEALHDHALQNLLSARHELEEAGEANAHPALARADEALAATIAQLREAVFALHPYVLEQAGLEPALRSIAQEAADRSGLKLRLDLRSSRRHPREQLLFSAARELLANVVEHADAKRVTVQLVEVNGSVELVVEDDGRGFPAELPAAQLANGHVGLASQRVRIEAAGGSMRIASTEGVGTRVEIRLPHDP
jgi:two-component system NarL family sensor kinase